MIWPTLRIFVIVKGTRQGRPLSVTMAIKTGFAFLTYRQFFIPHILVACTIIAINSILIYALRKRKKLRIITYKLIYVQSIADCFTGISILIGDVVMELLSSNKDGTMALKISVGIKNPMICFGVLMILIIAVDRYLHMTRMNNYNLVMTHRKANILVICCAVFTVIYACMTRISNLYDFYAEVIITTTVIGLVCIIIIILLYYQALRSITNSVHSENLDIENRNIRNAGREVSKAVFLILTCLLFTMMPAIIFTSCLVLMKSQKWTQVALYTSYVFFNLNPTLNAIIVIYFSRDLRSCVRQLFSIQCWQ